MRIEEIRAKLEAHGSQVWRDGPGHKANCPAHPDRTPSLGIHEGDDRILIHCRAGCDPADVMAALGLGLHDLFYEAVPNGVVQPRVKPATKRKDKSALPALDRIDRWAEALQGNARLLARAGELGKPWTMEACRQLEVGFDGERFTFPLFDREGGLTGVVRYSPNPGEGESKSLAVAGSDRDLFPRPETIEGDELWIVEGEPDAVTAQSLELPAVGYGGTGNRKRIQADRFAGRKRIIVVADSSPDGRQAATAIADLLEPIVPDVRVLDIEPGRSDGYDLSDFAAEAGDTARPLLLKMADGLPSRQQATADATGDLLEAVLAFIKRFVVLPGEHEANALALWVLHTHAQDAADATPYLAITSPEKGCGKTQLLEVLELLTARAWRISAPPSEAVLFRKIEATQPTVLLDEVDRLFKTGSERQEPLVALLNAGNRRGATVPRCVGDKHEIRDFNVYGPKALAGIDHLRWPDTVRDRAIPLKLQRKEAGETIERFRVRQLTEESRLLNEQLEQWANAAVAALESLRPEDMDDLTPRAFAGWEPLLAIAMYAGGSWPTRARTAALALSANHTEPDESLATGLLRDVRDTFADIHEDKISTKELVDRLCKIEEAPWATYGRGNPITPNALSSMLKRYGLRAKKIRFGDVSLRGFSRDQFEPIWRRYLPDSGSRVEQAEHSHSQAKNGDSQGGTQDEMFHPENGRFPSPRANVPCVPPRTGEPAQNGGVA